MWVIEGIGADGAVVDIFVASVNDCQSIVHPVRGHFTDDRVQPWIGSAYDSQEAAAAELPDAVQWWAHAVYHKHEGTIVTARVVPLNPNGHANGYIVAGSTDPDVWGMWYREWRFAAKAWHALLRKKAKNRIKGEFPNIEWYTGQYERQA